MAGVPAARLTGGVRGASQKSDEKPTLKPSATVPTIVTINRFIPCPSQPPTDDLNTGIGTTGKLATNRGGREDVTSREVDGRRQ